ncbi:hypothetical protein B0A50_07779 [Salinomyces thailandicus]|uniref:MOZ protein represents a chromatin-associated acetyltransferase n=1 Tax=Salinomyces thailandicus TaxID=706561 RepID=A0A4U0TLT6_9PEZI|nr:hypothetical protein B0A50_07779 [Salinomyces thailandica]
MAAPRLPFLWPILFRSAEASAPAARTARAAIRRRTLYSTTRRRQHEQIPQRYGPANEPPPHLGGGKGLGSSARKASEEQTKLPKIGRDLQKDGEEAQDGLVEEEAEAEAEAELDQRAQPTTVDGDFAKSPKPDPMLGSADGPENPDEQPIDSVLDSVPDPAQYQEEQHQQEASSTTEPNPPPEDEHPHASPDDHTPPIRAPHIEPPRHVHHFDTYGLVKQLDSASWDTAQAITIMKAVRLIMADNMDLANAALVSKSMVENELYLFRAACAELKTEITSRRRGDQEKMRAERTQLHHEVDILSQRLGQESGAMKDEVKGMFDDRKMGVRNEQREMDSKVQQLNYKITVNLQADARSEIEGLRWVMTRRVIIALGVVVIMVLGSLKLASSVGREQELEAKRRANMKSVGAQTEGRGEEFGVGGGENSKGIGGGEILVKDGDNPSFVSLG